jgi:VIT1/CCC1 family predicted Fe2+/Mn2+ transporter
VLFGLIMVLTFTGSLSITEAGREDIHAMLIGALGCNIAWGVIDGVFYLMGCLAERGRHLATYRAVLQAGSPIEARRLIADALPPVLASAIAPAEFDRMRQRLLDVGPPPAVARLTGSDWRGAAAVFLLVFFSTLPVTVPFIVLENPMAAVRASNAVAIVILFAAGVAYGRVVERPRWILGIAMVLMGASLVALTIALGG